MVIEKRGPNAERTEMVREAEKAKNKKAQGMLEYIAAMDYPEILPEDEEEEENE